MWKDPTSITGKPWEPWECQAMAPHGGPLLGGSSQGTKLHPHGPTTNPLGKSSGKWGPWCG